MNLKNYTSTTASTITIAQIESYLIDAGAVGIAKEIKQGRIVSVMFNIPDEDDKLRTVRLPADIQGCAKYLFGDYLRSHVRPKKNESDFLEQAERTAWKIVYEWIQIQLSMVKLKQKTLLQVFLADLWDGNQTYYEYLRGAKFKALPAPTEVA